MVLRVADEIARRLEQPARRDVDTITVNGNWRVTFKFEGADAVLVDYVDYH